MSRRLAILIGVSILVVLPEAASACAACMGDPNSKSAGAINGAIFLMLGFIALILGSVGGFMFYLVRRANSPTPPHAELAQMMTSPEESK